MARPKVYTVWRERFDDNGRPSKGQGMVASAEEKPPDSSQVIGWFVAETEEEALEIFDRLVQQPIAERKQR